MKKQLGKVSSVHSSPALKLTSALAVVVCWPLTVALSALGHDLSTIAVLGLAAVTVFLLAVLFVPLSGRDLCDLAKTIKSSGERRPRR